MAYACVYVGGWMTDTAQWSVPPLLMSQRNGDNTYIENLLEEIGLVELGNEPMQ